MTEQNLDHHSQNVTAACFLVRERGEDPNKVLGAALMEYGAALVAGNITPAGNRFTASNRAIVSVAPPPPNKRRTLILAVDATVGHDQKFAPMAEAALREYLDSESKEDHFQASNEVSISVIAGANTEGS